MENDKNLKQLEREYVENYVRLGKDSEAFRKYVNQVYEPKKEQLKLQSMKIYKIDTCRECIKEYKTNLFDVSSLCEDCFREKVKKWNAEE